MPNIAQQLHQPCIEKAESLQKLSFEVQMVKAQLQEQISVNHDVMTQFDSAKSQTQRLLGHKDSEISRLMSEVSSLSLTKLGLRRDWLRSEPLASSKAGTEELR